MAALTDHQDFNDEQNLADVFSVFEENISLGRKLNALLCVTMNSQVNQLIKVNCL